MTFTKISHRNSAPGNQESAVTRPRFNSLVTSDRLRESSKLPSLPMVSNIRKGRRSMFKEVGLLEEEREDQSQHMAPEKYEESDPGERVGSASEATSPVEKKSSDREEDSKGKSRWFSKLAPTRRPRIKTASSAPPPSFAGLHKLSMIALLIAIVVPTISYNTGRKKVEISGADAGVIRPSRIPIIENRDNSPTDVCTRWAGQSALINGTVYFYGGRSKTSGDQQSDTWNNDFISLDLTKSWDISSPALTGLAQPSGPPAVSLGYLWNDLDRLYLYGGEFSDSPVAQPSPVSTWMYDVASSTWQEFQNPTTSAGNFSDPEGVPVQRAAEGAGISVPELGVSWYFGGHLDLATTPGWSNQIARVYLKSLLEFTHPGYANSGVDSLHASGAPEGGAYRNITWGGIQNQDGFTERADGVLVYVPGWGPNGILLGLGGGVVGDHETTDAFASMSTIDVYDIKTSAWYHQETSGEAPQVRVNPCAVIFSAPDASSFNIYMYGGQNLLPYGNQTQYTDIWILTVPSFTWIKVDLSTADEPPARAGHQCAARDGQMIVIGGYVGTQIACDTPGIYNFDASNLQWKSSFDAADHPADAHSDNSILAGSYGYKVPDIVQSVVGGSSDGGATATQPASGPATDGPFKTGTPPVFTITQAGTTATITNSPSETGSTGGGEGGGSNPSNPVTPPSGTNGGLIAAGVIAGLAGLSALYLGFCAWLYRRQVAAYKRHMAVANRYSGATTAGGLDDDGGAFLGVAGGAAGVREKLRKHRRGSSSGDSEHFGWVGHLSEPKWMAASAAAGDDVSPMTSASGSGSGRPRPSEDRNPWAYDSYVGGASGVGGGGLGRSKSGATRSTASGGSAEALLDGRQPNFISVVLGPRRALRVVNGMEESRE
ncbi:RNAPII degradation factor [Hypoxylon texense]